MGSITPTADRVVKTSLKGLAFRPQAMKGIAFNFIPGFGPYGKGRRGKSSLGGSRGPLLDFEKINGLATKIHLLVVVHGHFKAPFREVIASALHQHGGRRTQSFLFKCFQNKWQVLLE